MRKGFVSFGRTWYAVIDMEHGEPPKQQSRWRVILSGAVQHVGLRYTALYLCRELKLTGWVMNLPDGRVTLEIQGDLTDLRRFLVQIKSQPPIHIAHAAIQPLPLEVGERGFRVRRYGE